MSVHVCRNGCWKWLGKRIIHKTTPRRHLWVKAGNPLTRADVLQPLCGEMECVNPRHQQVGARKCRMTRLMAADIRAGYLAIRGKMAEDYGTPDVHGRALLISGDTRLADYFREMVAKHNLGLSTVRFAAYGKRRGHG